MKEKNNIYVVACVNGDIAVSVYESAKNHWDAERKAVRKFFEKYKKNPASVKSRKCSKKELEKLSLDLFF